MESFLESLRKNGLVRKAAEDANVTLTVAYAYREQTPEFAARWDEAILRSIEDLEAVARKRAVEYSDTLLIFLLKGNNPEKFGDKVTINSTEKIMARVQLLAQTMNVDPGELQGIVNQLLEEGTPA